MEEIKSIQKFFKERKGILVGFFILMAISHGAMLFSDVMSIDTEIVISDPEWCYRNWTEIGRPALVALKAMTGTLQYNPYLAGIITFIGLPISCFIIIYFMIKMGRGIGQETLAAAAAGMIILTHPILTEQLSFGLQSAEICLGFALVGAAAYWAVCWATGQSKGRWILAVVGAIFTFLLYQSFVFLYISMVIEYLFLYAFGKGRDEGKKAGLWIGKSIFLFAAAFGVYTVLVRLFFTGSDYLNSNNYWIFSTAQENIVRILKNFILYFAGDSIFHTGYMLVIYILLAIAVILRFRAGEAVINKWVFLILAGEFLMPFLMVFALGGPPQSYRAELDVVFAEGAMAYSAVLLGYEGGNGLDKRLFLRGKRTLGIIALCVAVLIGWEQLGITLRMYKTREAFYEKDAFMAYQICEEIDRLQGEDRETYPVYIAGKYRLKLDSPAFETGETMGATFFGWMDDPVFHNKRVLGFLTSLGYQYCGLEQEEIIQLEESGFADGIPSWPQEGSVSLKEGIIIVKLSD